MKKIKLDILGLTYSQTQSGAYTLVLGEHKGKRRLSVIIGGFEAQAIAIELERMTPNRPLTHDLFKNFGLAFGIAVTEVIIYNLVEGVFYAKLICVSDNKTVELDTRTSDAIAIAVRFQCPIYTFEFILYKHVTLTFDFNMATKKMIEEFQPDVIHVASPSCLIYAGIHSSPSLPPLETTI